MGISLPFSDAIFFCGGFHLILLNRSSDVSHIHPSPSFPGRDKRGSSLLSRIRFYTKHLRFTPPVPGHRAQSVRIQVADRQRAERIIALSTRPVWGAVTPPLWGVIPLLKRNCAAIREYLRYKPQHSRPRAPLSSKVGRSRIHTSDVSRV